MKQAFNNEGFLVEVPVETVVKTVDGKHYLLTPEDEIQISQKEAEWQEKAAARALKKVYKDRNLERGSLEKQWEYFIDNGYDALKKRDNEIKAKHPKP